MQQLAMPLPSTSTTPRANAALFYSSQDYRTSDEKLMGRNAATENFLEGMVKYSGFENLYCYSQNRNSLADFADRVQGFAPAGTSLRAHFLDALQGPSVLDSIGCLYVPDPNMSRFAWQRRMHNQRAYSLCGVTHTISSEGVMDTIGQMLVSPLQAWDAVICTSKVVRQSIETFHAHWGEYLGARFGAAPVTPQFQLPVIPLGVNCSHFDAQGKEHDIRAAWRSKLGIGEDDIAFLFVGRLSFHAKAHPTPMYLALERAAQATGKRIHMIQSGWFANDHIKTAFQESARYLCPSVNMIFLDGREPATRREIWFAADIFTSLSDNIQETFGLTPLEAMAAGLPVVVTDWDGYRETVRDGIDGITIPTLMPAPGGGVDLAYRFEMGVDNYDLYIGNACQGTSVDIEACASAYTTLINDKNLRQKMGQAGKERAQNTYDWRHIIQAYTELWYNLSEIRKTATESAPRTDARNPSNPLRPDPFTFFSSYPTTTLTGEETVRFIREDAIAHYTTCRQLLTHRFGYTPPEELCQPILNAIGKQPGITVATLLSPIPTTLHPIAQRAIVWFAKMGVVSVGEHNG